MRVLIGFDGSEHSDAAIEDLKHAGLPQDCTVLIATVADLLMSSPELSKVIKQTITPRRVAAGLDKAQSHAERITKEALENSRRAKTRVKKMFPGWDVSAEVMIGTPGWVLVDVANKWNADLVVVGSQGHSALKSLFLGSVSKRVVADSRCSVRVVKVSDRAEANDSFRILVGVDCSPASEQAIHEIGQRVWPDGTEVRLVWVDDSTPTTQVVTRLPQATALINSYYRKSRSRVAAMLRWATRELSAIGLKTSVAKKAGSAKSVLVDEAREWNADSIFVGTRDFSSSFERFRLGSVSSSVVTNAGCTVEIVRPSANAALGHQ